jgi:hypothetical protein
MPAMERINILGWFGRVGYRVGEGNSHLLKKSALHQNQACWTRVEQITKKLKLLKNHKSMLYM